MTRTRRWCTITLVERDGGALAECLLRGTGRPDLSAVDVVAHLALLAKRRGGGVVLTDVCGELEELLAVAGLRVEVQGKPERREEPLVVQEVQEERHRRDLPA
jgi:hypothetical protein